MDAESTGSTEARSGVLAGETVPEPFSDAMLQARACVSGRSRNRKVSGNRFTEESRASPMNGITEDSQEKTTDEFTEEGSCVAKVGTTYPKRSRSTFSNVVGVEVN